MKETLGAIIGAIYAFLSAVMICGYLQIDVVWGLLLCATSPIIGAIAGGICFHRIRWHKKSVALTTRCAMVGALLAGTANLLIQIYRDGPVPLPDFLNALVQFLYGTFIGIFVGICVGRVLLLRLNVDYNQEPIRIASQPTNETWPPPPTNHAN